MYHVAVFGYFTDPWHNAQHTHTHTYTHTHIHTHTHTHTHTHIHKHTTHTCVWCAHFTNNLFLQLTEMCTAEIACKGTHNACICCSRVIVACFVVAPTFSVHVCSTCTHNVIHTHIHTYIIASITALGRNNEETKLLLGCEDGSIVSDMTSGSLHA